MDLKLRSVVTGVLSHTPGLYAWWDRRRPMGNTSSAQYCRGIWQFHLNQVKRIPDFDFPKAVGELGPGASLGACIAALLDGAELAIAFDAGQYATRATNLEVFDELAASAGKSIDFQALRACVSEAGIPGRESALRYAAPWNEPDVCQPASLDLIFSHSVMEHVVDPAKTYKECYRWLRPGGLMSHRIDHSSHGITRSWCGHFAISDRVWKIVFGKRPYLLNRWHAAQHVAAIKAAGFELLVESRFLTDLGAGGYRELATSDGDVGLVRTSTMLARKPH